MAQRRPIVFKKLFSIDLMKSLLIGERLHYVSGKSEIPAILPETKPERNICFRQSYIYFLLPETKLSTKKLATSANEYCCGCLSPGASYPDKPSMRHPVPPQHLDEGQPQDPDVKPKGLALQIGHIQLDLFRNRQLVAAIDLRPTGQARHQGVHTLHCAQSNQVLLVTFVDSGAI